MEGRGEVCVLPPLHPLSEARGNDEGLRERERWKGRERGQCCVSSKRKGRDGGQGGEGGWTSGERGEGRAVLRGEGNLKMGRSEGLANSHTNHSSTSPLSTSLSPPPMCPTVPLTFLPWVGPALSSQPFLRSSQPLPCPCSLPLSPFSPRLSVPLPPIPSLPAPLSAASGFVEMGPPTLSPSIP